MTPRILRIKLDPEDLGLLDIADKHLQGTLWGMGVESEKQFCRWLAGFTNRTESEYDPFGAGHSSTSVSAALGMAVGRDFKVRATEVVGPSAWHLHCIK